MLDFDLRLSQTMRWSRGAVPGAVPLLLTALLCGGLQAKMLTGKIGGEVFNLAPTGERRQIAGAKVVLLPVPGAHPLGSKPIRMQSATDEAGKFLFKNVSSGCYRVRATSAGLTVEADELCLLAPGGAISLAIEMTNRPKEMKNADASIQKQKQEAIDAGK